MGLIYNPKFFSAGIPLTNHYEYPFKTREAVAYTYIANRDERLIVDVHTFGVDENDNKIHEKVYDEKYVITATGDDGPNATEPRRNPLTGALVYKYQIQPEATRVLVKKGTYVLSGGSFIIDSNPTSVTYNQKIETPEWSTSISEATFFQNLSLGTRKAIYGTFTPPAIIDDSTTWLNEREPYFIAMILDQNAKGRFNFKGDKV